MPSSLQKVVVLAVPVREEPDDRGTTGLGGVTESCRCVGDAIGTGLVQVAMMGSRHTACSTGSIDGSWTTVGFLPRIRDAARMPLRVLRRRFPHFAQGSLMPLMVFLLVCCSEACAFIMTVGPLTMPDPDLHLSGTYALATLQSFNATNEVESAVGTKGGGLEKKRLQMLHGDSRYLRQHTMRNVLIESLHITSLTEDYAYDAQVGELDSVSHHAVTTPMRSNQYLFVVFIPQAIGMRIGWLLGLPPSKVLTLARVSNVLFYMVCLGVAIRVVPRAKWLLAFIGCLPIAVFCSSSLMADGVVIGFSTFFVALSLYLCSRRRGIGWAGWCLLVIMGVVECLMKFAYAPLALLPLMAIRSMNRPQRTAYAGAVIGFAALITIWWQRNYALVIRPETYRMNKELLLARPFESFATVMINVVVGTFDVVVRDRVLVFGLLIFLMAFVVAGHGRFPRESITDSYGRMIFAACIVVGVASLILVWLSLFLTWNDLQGLGNWAIRLDGFQERYLCPILPLLVGMWFVRAPEGAPRGYDATRR